MLTDHLITKSLGQGVDRHFLSCSDPTLNDEGKQSPHQRGYMVVPTPVGSTSHHPLQAHLWCWQSRIQKHAKQFQPHLPFKPRSTHCLQPPVPSLLKQSR